MLVVGIDIGGMSIKGALVNEQGKVLNTFSLPIICGEPSEQTISNLAKAIKSLITDNGYALGDVIGIGVGCPGAIDSTQGIVNYSNNLAWNDVPLKSLLEKGTGIPVKITNDANAATLGEAKFGSGKDNKNLIIITLGTGVGGGIIIDGKLYEGNDGKGAEIGHTVIVVDGEQCTCGRKGCFEAYSSASALIKKTKKEMMKDEKSLLWSLAKNDINNVNGKLAFDGAKAGDKCAEEIIEWYVKYLGEGILNFCNIFRPDAIILSGGIANQGDYLINKLVKYCEDRDYGYKRTPAVQIKRAVIGYESGMIGAAALFID